MSEGHGTLRVQPRTWRAVPAGLQPHEGGAWPGCRASRAKRSRPCRRAAGACVAHLFLRWRRRRLCLVARFSTWHSSHAYQLLSTSTATQPAAVRQQPRSTDLMRAPSSSSIAGRYWHRLDTAAPRVASHAADVLNCGRRHGAQQAGASSAGARARAPPRQGPVQCQASMRGGTQRSSAVPSHRPLPRARPPDPRGRPWLLA